MNRYAGLFVTILASASIFSAAACSDDSVVDNKVGKVLKDLDIKAANDTALKVGNQSKFNAIAKYTDGTDLDVSSDPGTVWTSSDMANATVDATGLVTGIDEGTTTIKVTYNGMSSDEGLVITP